MAAIPALLIASLALPLTSTLPAFPPGDPTEKGAQISTPVKAAAPEADRQAILGMLGEYAVTFAFDETVVLQDGYERTEPNRSRAREVVILVEDAGDRIVLQHILVAPGGFVTKHWRQDWHFEAPERLEFVADQRWELRPIPEDRVAGGWTQCVFEVSDAPRYCGTGTWNHRYGVATWTSDRSWRPLPRREYTKRSDYNALNVENRHTVTSMGWTHEQDNTKTLRNPDGSSRTLVREFGFNDYVRTDEVDFSPAYEYWEQTRGFWQEVRGGWDRLIATGGLTLAMEVDGMPLIEAFFQMADEIRDGEQVTGERIDQAFAEWVLPGERRAEDR